MPERRSLEDRLQAHRDKFEAKKDRGSDYSAWFLHMVVFPSLRDIARELDRLSAAEARRAKGADTQHGEAEGQQG